MTYARARLWLGMSGVGFWTALSAAGLFTHLPQRLFPVYQVGGWSGDIVRLGAVFGAYLLLSLPFDLLGGYLLPRKYERSALPFGAFFVRWLRGALGHGAILLLIGLGLLLVGREVGVHAAVLGVLVGMLLLFLLQFPIAWLLSGIRLSRAGVLNEVRDRMQRWGVPFPPIVVVDTADPGFVGGFASIGRDRVLIPLSWLEQLPAETVATLIIRRLGVLETGSRMRGVAVAMGFNAVGFYLATLIPGANLSTVAGLLTTMFGFTLWSFLGALVLPTVSRLGVFEADRYASDKGVPIPTIERAIRALDRRQDDEPARSPLIETIFHPIPSVENRLHRIVQLARPRGAWHAARMALYLSWACLGLLSRAVHCNSGRPELWVFFPGD